LDLRIELARNLSLGLEFGKINPTDEKKRPTRLRHDLRDRRRIAFVAPWTYLHYPWGAMKKNLLSKLVDLETLLFFRFPHPTTLATDEMYRSHKRVQLEKGRTHSQKFWSSLSSRFPKD